MADGIHWTARCAYPGRADFLFYSPAFVVDHWSELDQAARAAVTEAWAKISPHPPPDVIELIPGHLAFVGPRR